MSAHQHRCLPGLSERMRIKRATNVALATRAGVAVRTIVNARCGKKLRKFLADAVDQALENNEFSRDPRGAR